MSVSNKRTRRNTTLIGALLGLIIIFTFVVSLFTNPGTSTSVVPTSALSTPRPTSIIVPTPDSDPHLEGELPYIHRSGLFQTFRPAGSGWSIDDNPFTENGDRLDVVIQSTARLVVIHNYVLPGTEYESLQSLSDNFLNESYYAAEWSNYASWEETGREVTSDTVSVNFDLSAESVDYVARDISRLDGATLYVARMVVPSNNPTLLDLLSTDVQAAFFGYEQLQGVPRAWPAYIDQQLGFVLKYPTGWQTVAGAPGRPATIRSASGQPDATIRLEAHAAMPLTSAEDAEAWVSGMDDTITVQASVPLEHPTGTGYQVAYESRDAAGDRHSGLVVVLNDTAGTLYVANLQMGEGGVNLIDTENLTDAQLEARSTVMDGFMVLPPGSHEELVLEATPVVTEAPAAEATQFTAEATAEVVAPARTEAASETSAIATADAEATTGAG